MKVYLCIDIGGTAIKYDILNEEYNSIEADFNKEIKTPLYAQDFLACMEEIYNKTKKYNLSGIAISCPGKIDKSGNVIDGGCVSYLPQCNLKIYLEELSGLSVSIENDGICAALAELEIGSLKDCSDAIVAIFGTGIAGALIFDRKIRRGFHNVAGEFSFVIMGAGFYNEETLWSADNGDYSLRQLVSSIKNIPIDKLDGRKIFQMANEGDEEVKIIIDNYTKIIARNFYNLQTVCDVEKIAVGGGISSQDLFIEGIKKNLKEYEAMIEAPIVLPQIVRCQFGSEANLVGALINLK